MSRLTLTIILVFSAGHLLFAQSLDPSALRSPEDHVAFFDTIFQLHQELGPVILAHGWESPEHLALRDSTMKRNADLRDVVDGYLNIYGFPTPSQELLARRKAAQAELMKAMGEEMKRRMTKDLMRDSIARDSIVLLLGQSYGKDIALRDTWPTVMLILGTEPDFDKRCEHISWLRHEWEEGNLSTQSMLTYLQHTYAAKHGTELEIATGSTDRERIFMHARELSGCWGN